MNKLKIRTSREGKGAEAEAGQRATVDYTLWLADGTKIESSKDSGQPYPFVVGAGEVIPGWDQGVPGMKVGGKRKLISPAGSRLRRAGFTARSRGTRR